MYAPDDHATLPFVPEGKGKPRIVVELVTAEEEAFGRQVRAAAALQGVTIREWVLAALREKWERERAS